MVHTTILEAVGQVMSDSIRMQNLGSNSFGVGIGIGIGVDEAPLSIPIPTPIWKQPAQQACNCCG